MYQLHPSQHERILIVEFSGKVSLEEANQHFEDLQAFVRKVKGHFVIVTDISKMKVSTQEVSKVIQESQEYAHQNGLKKVIRVADELFSKMQLARTSREVGYNAEYVSTRKEAVEHAIVTLKEDLAV